MACQDITEVASHPAAFSCSFRSKSQVLATRGRRGSYEGVNTSERGCWAHRGVSLHDHHHHEHSLRCRAGNMIKSLSTTVRDELGGEGKSPPGSFRPRCRCVFYCKNNRCH